MNLKAISATPGTERLFCRSYPVAQGAKPGFYYKLLFLLYFYRTPARVHAGRVRR